VNLIEGKNVIKNKLSKSIQMILSWEYKDTDAMEINFSAGKGTIKLPVTWSTVIKYKDLKEGLIIDEDWKPTEVLLK